MPQSFDQCLPDGTRASITLSGVDGLKGDALYLREDVLWQYVGDRDVVVFSFGERGLRPYPPSPPQWLLDAQRQQTNAWRAVVMDLGSQSPAPKKKRTTKKHLSKPGVQKSPKTRTAKRKKQGDGAAKS